MRAMLMLFVALMGSSWATLRTATPLTPGTHVRSPRGTCVRSPAPQLDLGSGSNCDITIIRKGGETERIRGYEKPNDVAPIRAQYSRPSALQVPTGATEILSSKFVPLQRALVVEDASPMAL